MTPSPRIPPGWNSFAARSKLNWNALLDTSKRSEQLAQMSLQDLEAAMRSWMGQAHPAQLPPEVPDWRTWLFLGGRGAGKTRAGAEWLTAQAVPGARLALIGPTLHDVREVMVEGNSGLTSIGKGDPDFPPPVYESSRRRLRFANGALAFAFSAEDPDSLRGPQFHHAWADEFCAWPEPEAVLAQVRLGLRLGEAPQLVVTTTPKPIAALRRLMAEPDLALTRAGTAVNAANLSPVFMAGLERLYGGTKLAAQELEGLVVELDGTALWRASDFPPIRTATPPDLDRIVLAVDPCTTATGDACGLVVAARRGDTAHVIADRTASGLSPLGWAGRVAAAAAEFGVHSVVAEANQGGEMVRTLIHMAGCTVPLRLVHAKVSKRLRAEPVAALYEQGRVRHAPGLFALEEELLALGQNDTRNSPDRADALVWALTELMLEQGPGPRVARL
jgi:phage terminase large subunit-like protein